MFTLDLIIKSGAVFSHFKPKVQLPTIHCHSMFKDLACSTCIHLLPMSKLIMCAYFVRFLRGWVNLRQEIGVWHSLPPLGLGAQSAHEGHHGSPRRDCGGEESALRFRVKKGPRHWRRRKQPNWLVVSSMIKCMCYFHPTRIYFDDSSWQSWHISGSLNQQPSTFRGKSWCLWTLLGTLIPKSSKVILSPKASKGYMIGSNKPLLGYPGVVLWGMVRNKM